MCSLGAIFATYFCYSFRYLSLLSLFSVAFSRIITVFYFFFFFMFFSPSLFSSYFLVRLLFILLVIHFLCLLNLVLCLLLIFLFRLLPLLLLLRLLPFPFHIFISSTTFPSFFLLSIFYLLSSASISHRHPQHKQLASLWQHAIGLKE